MKRQWKRRLLATILSLTMLLSLVPGAFAQENGGESNGLRWKQVSNDDVSASLLGREELKQPEEKPLYGEHEKVRVSIVLDREPTLAVFSLASEAGEEADAMAYREGLQAYQAELAEYISEEIGDELDVVWNLTLAANIISANVEYGQIGAIEEMYGVDSVIVETRYEVQGKPVPYDPDMAISSDMTNTFQAWDVGYTGAGMRIAIIDTGLDIEHQSFDNDAFLHALEEDGDVDLLDEAEIAGVLGKLNATAKRPGVTAAQLHYNDKLPFCFNYVDGNLIVDHVHDDQGEHGSHVAGIAAANRYLNNGDGTFSDAMETVKMVGNAPDAQVLVMKVFGAGGGAYDSDYMVAIEDAVLLGCDTVNLSLGSGNPGLSYTTGSTTLGEKEKVYQDIMDNLVNTDTVVNFSAGNSGTWAESSYNGVGLPYSDDVVFQTDGSPGSFTNAFTVASVDNNGMVLGAGLTAYGRTMGFTESSYTNKPISTLDAGGTGTEYDFVYVNTTGVDEDGNSDFAKVDVRDKIALCNRGTSNFSAKANAAAAAGAIAVIVCNNQAGTINMDLSDYTYTAPVISITLDNANFIKANAAPATVAGLSCYTGKLTITGDLMTVPGANDYETMSSFSSWGVPGNLMLKPEITAPGGNIWSLNGAHNGDGAHSGHDVYELMSGTSMASPQMAGIGALVKQYIEENNLSAKTDVTDRALAMSLMMSTATPLVDEYGDYYSVFQQGAGMVNTEAAVNADSYILMGADATPSYADGKVKIEMGDDPDRTGKYSFTFTINNLKDVPLTYTLDADVFTQYPVSDGRNYFLHTYTLPLEESSKNLLWSVKSVVSGAGGSRYDFDGNGVVDLDDGDALLDLVTGVRDSLYHEDEAYFGRSDITSYNGHLFLQKLSTNGDKVTVPANGSVTISATIQLDQAEMDELMEICPNGAYVEAYVKIDTVADEEDALHTSHSIPFLAFYGSWTDPSMFEKGSSVEYDYGLETRAPYLGEPYANAVVLKYAGNSTAYPFGGNPYMSEETYRPERNALNNQNGDRLSGWQFTAIRNASASRLLVRNANTGAVYAESYPGAVSSAYYYTNGQAWRNTGYTLNLNWAGTDADKAPLADGTAVELSLTLAPELYGQTADSVDWDALGEGASQKMRVTIDNKAPVMAEVAYDAASKTLTVTAKDNQYVAAVMLVNESGTMVLAAETPDQTKANTMATVKLDLSEVVGKSFYIVVGDYACNETTYKFDKVLSSDIEAYYSGFDQTTGRWVSYSESGSKRGTISMDGLDICAGAYAKGYVFAFDEDLNFYTYDASNPSVLGSPVRIVPKEHLGIPDIGLVADLAYDESTDTMYVLYAISYGGFYYDFNSIGTIDLLTGEITPLVDPDDFLDAAAPDDFWAEPYGIAAHDGTVYAAYFSMQKHNFGLWLASFDFNGGSIQNFTDIGDVTDIVDPVYYICSLDWDSAKDELVLASGEGIYKVDTTDATATKIPGTKTVVSLFTPAPEGEETLPASEEAVVVKLSAENARVMKDTTTRLTANVLPWNLPDTSVTWTSSDASIATVNANGVVTGRRVGSVEITATSNATPSVSATCEVEVVAIDKDLQALVWDEEGTIWWSEFNTTGLPDYDKLQECDVRQLVSAVKVFDEDDNEIIYAATMNTSGGGSSALYTVDPYTFETTEVGGLPYWVGDMTYSSLMGSLFGLQGPFMLQIDPEDGSLIAPYDFFGYQSGQSDAEFIAIAEEGLYYMSKTQIGEVFWLIDTEGNLYQLILIGDLTTGSLSVRGGRVCNLGYSTDGLIYYNNAFFTTAEDGTDYLFWSQYDDGDYVNIIAIDPYTDEDLVYIYNLGSFPSGVWPVGGLMDTNGLSAASEATEYVRYVKNTEWLVGNPAASGAAEHVKYKGNTEWLVGNPAEDVWETVEPVERVDSIRVSESRKQQNDPAPYEEEVNTAADANEAAAESIVDVETMSMSAESNSGTSTVSNSLVTAQVTLDKASANGLIEVTYDVNELELIRVTGKATINSANTAEAENGKVTLAYAYAEAAEAGTAVATLMFNSKTMRSTTVRMTTREDGLETPNTSVLVPVTFVVDEDPVYIPTPGGNRPGGGGSSGGGTTKPVEEPSKPVEEPTNPVEEPVTPVVPVNPSPSQFVDVPAGAWYAEYVDYVVGHGLMNGTSATTFAPDDSLTRAMLVTILHRSAGQPSAGGSISFSDVAAGSWYEAGVNWAAINSLVNGYGDGRFGPNGNITRQELAVILWRYAQMLGISVAADGTTIPDFADRGEIAPWAAEAMSWAYRMGIITGRDSTHLAPNGGASRVEAAAMLVRFLKLVENNQNPVA